MFQEYSVIGFCKDQGSFNWKELIDASKCSSCQDLSSNHTIKICIQGHLTCESCFAKANNACTVCKTVEMFNSPFVSKIFDILSTACKNPGCTFTGWGKDHFQICEFRLVSCYIIGCSWRGTVHVLLDHIEKSHPYISIVENGCCVLSSLHQLNQLKECKFVTPMKAHGCLFWKHDKVDYESKRFYSFVQCVPTSADHMDTISSIKMKKDKIEFSYFRKVYDLDVDENKIFKEVQCFSVPLDMIPYFADEENNVNYTCKIIKP